VVADEEFKALKKSNVPKVEETAEERLSRELAELENQKTEA